MKKNILKNKKKALKSEIEILEDIKTLKVQLSVDIENVIERYYLEILEKAPSGLSYIGAIDIISALELAKLHFYTIHENYLIEKKIFQNQVGV